MSVNDGKPKRTIRRWSDSEIALLRERYPDEDTVELAKTLGRLPDRVIKKACLMGIGKSDAYQKARYEKMRAAGLQKQFMKGAIPWNKGIVYHAEGRSVDHQFQPGHRPQNWLPIGSERMTKGYLERKVTDTGDTSHDFRLVHHLVWEEAGRGAVPVNHALVFRDGNRRNTDLDNLELVSRDELMRRNSCHNYGPEIAQLCQLVGAINRKINNVTKPKAAS
jgi:hypothetical protein